LSSTSRNYILFAINKINQLVTFWVDGELKLSFKRNFNQRMFWMWEDLVVIVQDRVLFDKDDQMVCKLNSLGVYSYME
jgi:hypothetical protein